MVIVKAATIILLALLNDIPILTIAYDNTLPESGPVSWQMRDRFTMQVPGPLYL